MNYELTEDEGKKIIEPHIDKLLDHFESIFTKSIDCIVIKDHQKGFITEDFLKKIAPFVNKRFEDNPYFFVVIDPKYDWDKFLVFDKIHAVTPNVKEAAAGIFSPINDAEKEKKENELKNRMKESALNPGDLEFLAEKYPYIENFVVTADTNGAEIFNPKSGSHLKMPAIPNSGGEEIGCGGVFDAVYVNCWLHAKEYIDKFGYSKPDMNAIFLRLANTAAGMKLDQSTSDKVTVELIKPYFAAKTL